MAIPCGPRGMPPPPVPAPSFKPEPDAPVAADDDDMEMDEDSEMKEEPIEPPSNGTFERPKPVDKGEDNSIPTSQKSLPPAAAAVLAKLQAIKPEDAKPKREKMPEMAEPEPVAAPVVDALAPQPLITGPLVNHLTVASQVPLLLLLPSGLFP